ncbi:polyprenyl synthetase family protein [Akkermansia muciniphila]|nr:polyprenyl synthetase family protein [Akkermansia muciniphila]
MSGVTPEVEESLYQLGDLLGVAYQIYDDCLDMVGDEDDAGKTLHTDATKGKLTLPIFNLLECGDRNVEATLRDAIENREVVDYSAFQDNPVFAEALDKAIQVALEKNEAAREILWLLPQTEYREALAEMTFTWTSCLTTAVSPDLLQANFCPVMSLCNLCLPAFSQKETCRREWEERVLVRTDCFFKTWLNPATRPGTAVLSLFRFSVPARPEGVGDRHYGGEHGVQDEAVRGNGVG